MYPQLEPVITEMYMAGIMPRMIAETLGLNLGMVNNSVDEWGLRAQKLERMRELAEQIAAKHKTAFGSPHPKAVS